MRNFLKVVKEYKSLVFAYIVVCILYYFFFVYLKASTYSLIDKLFSNGFANDVSSSIFSDLLFFLVFGFIATVISTIVSTVPIENHNYDTRTRALMNSEKVSNNDNAHTFLKACLSRFLLFNKKMKVVLEIEDLSTQKGAYKIYCDFTYIVTNMCKDKDFEPEDIKASVKPGENIDNWYGHVSRLEIFNPETLVIIRNLIDGNIIPLKDEEYSKPIDVSIGGNSEIGWRMSFCIWNKIGISKSNEDEWFNIFIERYTQKIDIEIRNKTKKVLIFDLNYYDSSKKIGTLLSDKYELQSLDNISFSPRLEIYPRDLIQLFIYNPK